MSWQDESINILRILINDFTSPETYSSGTLTNLLFASARYVVQEVNLTTDYTVDYTNQSITPDPSGDYDFQNFMILKAACLTNTWSFNAKAIQEGITARLGPAQLNIKGTPEIVLGLIREGPCATYQQLMDQFNFGNISVKGIFTPFTSNTFIPTDIGYMERIDRRGII